MRAAVYLLDLLFPPRCAFCRKILRDQEQGACRSCLAKLPYTPERMQIENLSHIRAAFSPLYYEGSVRDSLLRYKFHSVTAYKNIYAEFIAKHIDENQIFCDSITWVPLSRKRLRKRGYDQAELIARAVAGRLEVPCIRALAKVRNNSPQSSISSANQRKKNVAGIYRCINSEAVKGKTVLIIDDILTTGATLSECAKILKSAGAETIYAATVACAHR